MHQKTGVQQYSFGALEAISMPISCSNTTHVAYYHQLCAKIKHLDLFKVKMASKGVLSHGDVHFCFGTMD
jgi:hypothetical protein